MGTLDKESYGRDYKFYWEDIFCTFKLNEEDEEMRIKERKEMKQKGDGQELYIKWPRRQYDGNEDDDITSYCSD